MATIVRKIASPRPASLRDLLARLTFHEACKLLGPEGKQLIQLGASLWEINADEQVRFKDDRFVLRLDGDDDDGLPPIVTLTLQPQPRSKLRWDCSDCGANPCEHVGAAFSLILEDKIALGLAAVPRERQPIESLDEQSLVEQALAERAERAASEKMTVQPFDRETPWTDYTVTSRASGKTYRVALRGLDAGQSYCSCPDFRTNTLGTCKHVLHVAAKVKRKFTARQLKRPFQQKQLALHLNYVGEVTLRLLATDKVDPAVERIIKPLRGRPITDLHDLMNRLNRLQKAGHDVLIYPDAEEWIQQRLMQDRLTQRMAEIRRDPAEHPLRTTLLKTPLLPYQLDGIAFAVGAGRAILADDMGLGKTIQGVGTAEMLAREAGIRRVLVVCPTSLKSQWRSEIHRFCDRDVQLIGGPAAERASQYNNDAFFTICNYEQVLRDLEHIERVEWDLIILDEGQRIKNWEAKTSRVIKSLRSRFALVLSGTPLENRLDELYSVVQFIDGWRLGPGFRFFNRHRIVDEKGKVLGYKNLDEVRERLAPVLLRRTRDSVRLELPPRTTEIVRIAPTAEQIDIHNGHMRTVVQITRKRFISEMDLLRLQKALLMCRMVADSTFLVTKEAPGFSTKLGHLEELLEQLLDDPSRKVVLFSEWTTMLNLIEPMLARRKADFVRLDGGVPQAKRASLVQRFQDEPRCRLFLTTNAGSTGLNLQSANTVINVDLPWNPAVLEQRIARAHRMGQTQPVQVYVLVTEQTIEENLLATLAAKKDLALAALDAESEVNEVELASGIEELKRRLEVLLGSKPDAPEDVSMKQQVASESAAVAQRERVAAAGGELLGAAFKFLGELVAASGEPAVPETLVAQVRSGLGSCVEANSDGTPRLVVALPSQDSLDQLAQTLARLLVASGHHNAD